MWKVTWAHPEFGQVLASCSFDRTAAVWEEQGNRKTSYTIKILVGCYGYSLFNPLTPEDFHVFERFSAFTRPIGLRDSIFKVTIESAAVLKH